MKAKVLFLDDEPEMLFGLHQNLRKADFEVITAVTVEGALDVLEKQDIDVVVSDQRMPKMSGHEFLAQVSELYPKSVRMMLSGQASTEELSLAINDGQIFKFIRKPVDPRVILETLEEGIKLRKSLTYGDKHYTYAAAANKSMQALERACPGITVVHRDDDGRILLESEEDDDETFGFSFPEFSKAIQDDQLRIHFQKIVDPTLTRAYYYEALVRWQHPRRGLLSPSEFLSEVEKTPLAYELGNWVINKVCSEKRLWKDKGLSDKKVSINISPKHLEQPNFTQNLFQAIERYEVDPCTLELEITESYAIKNFETTKTLLQTIKDGGVAIAIDDFGVGYNSLRYMHQLPIDVIKIDRSFVCDIVSNKQSATFVLALIQFGHQLNCKVVAEGVECTKQAELLREWGCDLLQGYLFSKPQALDGDLAPPH